MEVVNVCHRNHAMIKTREVEMMKLFSLRRFRILSVGGAKASTFGFDNGDDDEGGKTYYPL